MVVSAAVVIGCQNVTLLDRFWRDTSPEELAALHTAYNLVRAAVDHYTDARDLLSCAKSTRAYGSVRADFSRWLDDNIKEGMVAQDFMQLILQKEKWHPPTDIVSRTT